MKNGKTRGLARSLPRRRGCLAKCVSIPEEDLVSYIQHRHCFLRVFFGAVGLAKNSHWKSRMCLVLVSLLWSFSANCLVSAYVMARYDRISQVIVITLLDAFGVSLLSLLFYVVHADVVIRHCATACDLNVPAIFTSVLSLVLLVLLLVSIPKTQLSLAAYSFFPIWSTARVTEVFKLGTFWAIQVQYGSFANAPKPSPAVDPYLAKLELAAKGPADLA